MAFLWSNGVTLAIAVVAAALFALFALAQPDEGDEPAGTTSLLTAITLGAALLLFVRLARLHAVLPLGQSGTWTWVMAATAAVGAGLVVVRRSAGVALASMGFAAAAAAGGAIWLLPRRQARDQLPVDLHRPRRAVRRHRGADARRVAAAGDRRRPPPLGSR